MRIFNLILFASFIRAMCIFCMTTTKRQNSVNQIYKTGRIYRDNKPLMLILMLITIIKMASCGLLCQTFHFFLNKQFGLFPLRVKTKMRNRRQDKTNSTTNVFFAGDLFLREIYICSFFLFSQASRSELNKNRKSLLGGKQRNETV